MSILSVVKTKANEEVTDNRARMIVETTPELWGKRIAVVPLELMKIDYSYQRVVTKNVNYLTKKWNKDECDPLIVSFRDNAFYIIDGQHRYYAAKANNVESLLCVIRTGLTRKMEAGIYVKMNTSRKPLKPIDTFKANLINGDESIPEVAIDLKANEICKAYNVEISMSKNARCMPVYAARSSFQPKRKIDIEDGSKRLNYILSVITKTPWIENYKALCSDIIDSLNVYYTENKLNLKECEQKLINVMKDYSINEFSSYAIQKYPDYTKKASFALAFKELA